MARCSRLTTWAFCPDPHYRFSALHKSDTGPGNGQASPLDHGVHDETGGASDLAKVGADAVNGLALAVGMPDFPRGPVIHLSPINPGHDVAALIQGVSAAFHDSTWGSWSPFEIWPTLMI